MDIDHQKQTDITENDQMVSSSSQFNRPKTPLSDNTARKLQKVSAWLLIICALAFALVAILAVWGVFGDNSDAAWKSAASLGIIALTALIINVATRFFDSRS